MLPTQRLFCRGDAEVSIAGSIPDAPLAIVVLFRSRARYKQKGGDFRIAKTLKGLVLMSRIYSPDRMRAQRSLRVRVRARPLGPMPEHK